LEKTDVLFEFAKEHKETFKGIMKVFKDFLNRLKNAIKKLAGDKWGNSDEARLMSDFYTELAEVYKTVAKNTFEVVSNAANSGENTKSAENKKTPKGEKVQYSGKSEQYAEYDKPITVADVSLLRSIERKSVSKFTSEDLQKAQKWAYKFYKELGT
ncbi:MAG: hypothetical protein PUC29_00650, partial [Clostridia bacterium]|nr:hypothetical protein [Clostridia bacterium]